MAPSGRGRATRDERAVLGVEPAGVHRELIEAALDGKLDTANCIVWGRNGKLPTYTIRGCTFRNFMRDGAAHGDGKHTEALMLGSCETALVENNAFELNGGPGPLNGTGHMMIEAWGDSTDPNIENTWSDQGRYCVRSNTFGQTDAYYSVQVKEVFPADAPIYIDPKQPTVKTLCQRPEFVRACP